MSKRYLGGGISFEQKNVYQEFSEDDTPSPGGSSTLAGLTDVDISNPSDGQTLVYNATSGKWENGSGSGGSSTLVGLTDVDISNPSDGQTLVYDAASQKWVNGSAGGTLVVRQNEVGDDVFLDHTYAEIAAAAPNVVLDDSLGQMHNFTWIKTYGPQLDSWRVEFGNSTYTTNSESGYPKLDAFI